MKRLLAALTLVALTAAPALASPTSDVTDAMIKLGTAKSYHLNVTSRGQTVDVDFVKPDKQHVTVTGMEFIKLGAAMYTKMGGTWQKFAVPGVADRITGMFDGAIKNATGHPENLVVVDLGPKVVSGLPLHAYSIKDKDASVASTVYLDGRGTPVRLETNDGTTLVISKINDPIEIDAPI